MLGFWGGAETSLRFLAKLLIFHQHSRFCPGLAGRVAPVEREPTHAIKRTKALNVVAKGPTGLKIPSPVFNGQLHIL